MTSGGQFDPFNQARLPAPPLEGKGEERLVEQDLFCVLVLYSIFQK